jgi:hypothetical protein
LPNISRIDLIRKLRLCGCDGPYPGKDHPFMKNGSRKFKIPNPHDGDIGPKLLLKILWQAGITKEEWEKIE